MAENQLGPVRLLKRSYAEPLVASAREGAIADWLLDFDDETKVPPVCTTPAASSSTRVVASTPMQIATLLQASLRIAPIAYACPAPSVDAADLRCVGGRHRSVLVARPVLESHARHATGVGSSTRPPDADENWKHYRTRFTRTGLPSEHGIIDMRSSIQPGRTVCEGKILIRSTGALAWLLRGDGGQVGHDVEHKIGLCYDAKFRWEMYMDDRQDDKWCPDFLILLERPSNREAASYLEAALILWVKSHARYTNTSVNCRHGDVGGEGKRSDDTAQLPHYVYCALRVL